MNERYLLRTEVKGKSIEYSEHESLAEAQDARAFIIQMIKVESSRPIPRFVLATITIWHSVRVQEGGRPDTETT